jgi:hypothetical protein
LLWIIWAQVLADDLTDFLVAALVGLFIFGLSLGPINHSRPHVDNIFEAIDHGKLGEVDGAAQRPP